MNESTQALDTRGNGDVRSVRSVITIELKTHNLPHFIALLFLVPSADPVIEPDSIVNLIVGLAFADPVIETDSVVNLVVGLTLVNPLILNWRGQRTANGNAEPQGGDKCSQMHGEGETR